MALVAFAPLISTPTHIDAPAISLQSHFICTPPKLRVSVSIKKTEHPQLKSTPVVTKCSSSPHKLVRDPRFDKHVVKQNKIRFVQKLKTLLLSKPKHFMPIQVLYKCRPYLSLPKPRSVLTMIRRYPTIFELFSIPTPPTPFNATGPLSQLCVRLTPAAAALAKKESDLKKPLDACRPISQAFVVQAVHLGPDLGLPVNFRSRLCNDHPDKFKVVDTSYGRALELVTWDLNLAKVLPFREEDKSLGLIVDRPLKFKHLRLRKGLNVKRHHHEYLIKFREVPDVCPYKTNVVDLAKESIEAEKRACAVVREVLGMTVEKRTLVDHLTHFRKEFGLPNKLRGMLVRHPEMFYVSLKGQRDSVFLVEGYNDKGALVEKDEILVIKDELMKLVSEGKRLRREKRKEYVYGECDVIKNDAQTLENQVDYEYYDDCEDGLDDLFQFEDYSSEDDMDGDDESSDLTMCQEKGDYWTAETTPGLKNQSDGSEPW
ncbi:hypothetical protein DH2020_010726 [Rehmannia glutinosa]|uniref:PORR domain-containing protein n=1 Tax=Rehmannia glutinosa TaxID=99300 RepID=A0ABR0XBE3_REHGL